MSFRKSDFTAPFYKQYIPLQRLNKNIIGSALLNNVIEAHYMNLVLCASVSIHYFV